MLTNTLPNLTKTCYIFKLQSSSIISVSTRSFLADMVYAVAHCYDYSHTTYKITDWLRPTAGQAFKIYKVIAIIFLPVTIRTIYFIPIYFGVTGCVCLLVCKFSICFIAIATRERCKLYRIEMYVTYTSEQIIIIFDLPQVEMRQQIEL